MTICSCLFFSCVAFGAMVEVIPRILGLLISVLDSGGGLWRRLLGHGNEGWQVKFHVVFPRLLLEIYIFIVSGYLWLSDLSDAP